MKKLFLIFVLSLLVVWGIFAESDDNSDYRKMSFESSFETTIPFIMKEGVFGEKTLETMMYILIYTSIRFSYQFTFLSISDYFNLGIGLDFFQNPITIFDGNFMGGLGLCVYNDFLFNSIIVSPYAKSDWVYSEYKDSYDRFFYNSFIDFSAGINASYKESFIDICYNTAIVDLTPISAEIHNNAHSIRIGFGYKMFF